MATVKEQALVALHALLKAGLSAATVERNAVETGAIPPGGLVTLRDGEADDPEVYLGATPVYGFDHRAEIAVQVEQAAASVRDSALDVLLVDIADVIAADPTLGGLVDWVEAQEPETETEDVQGGHAIKAALLPVVITYTTTSRIG